MKRDLVAFVSVVHRDRTNLVLLMMRIRVILVIMRMRVILLIMRWVMILVMNVLEVSFDIGNISKKKLDNFQHCILEMSKDLTIKNNLVVKLA